MFEWKACQAELYLEASFGNWASQGEIWEGLEADFHI